MAALNLGYIIMIVVSVWCGWCVYNSRSPKWSTALFFGTILVSMFLLRLHQINWNHEYNPDESQMMAQSMRFLSHPMPWRDVDGETGGPLDSQILTAILYLGAPASWATGRIVLLILNFLTLIFLYRAIRCFASPEDSRLAIMPSVIFYAFVFHLEFVHYSSETLPVLLLAVGLNLLAEQWTAPKPSLIRWFLLGAVCGALPFAKMQSAPLGLFYGALGSIVIFVRCRRGQGKVVRVLRQVFALCCGGLAVPVLILVPVALCGAFDDFVNCYLRSSISYVGLEGPGQKLHNLWKVLSDIEEFWRYFRFETLTPLFLLPACWFFRKKNPRPLFYWLLFISFVYCLATLGCLAIAGKGFYHYAFFLVPAFTMFVGITLLCCKSMFLEPGGAAREMPWLSNIWFAGFVVALTLFQWKETRFFHHNTRNRILCYPDGRQTSIVGKRVREVREPGDTLAIWGWMPAYYLETGMPPATRNVQSRLLIEQPLHEAYYRNRFMADLETSRPPIFIDAIAGNQFEFMWTNAPNHETFPKLDDYLHKHYTLWLNVYMTNDAAVGWPIRVYMSNDRIEQLHLKHEDIYAKFDPFYPLPSANPNRQMASVQ